MTSWTHSEELYRVREHYSPYGSADSAGREIVRHRSGKRLDCTLRNPIGEHAVSRWEQMHTSHPDCFNHLNVFIGKSELFGLEILCHMLWVRRSGQRKHAYLHRKPKNNLRQTDP